MEAAKTMQIAEGATKVTNWWIVEMQNQMNIK